MALATFSHKGQAVSSWPLLRRSCFNHGPDHVMFEMALRQNFDWLILLRSQYHSAMLRTHLQLLLLVTKKGTLFGNTETKECSCGKREYLKRRVLSILRAFAKLQKLTISFVMSVRPSVCPHGTTRLSLDGFSWNVIFQYFSKLSRKFKIN